MANPLQPRRQRRLDRIFDSSAAYFLTLCTDRRTRALDQADVFERVRGFATGSPEHYGVFVDCLVLMPDHIHLIVTIAPDTVTTLGAWVKAFKAVVANRDFKWQAGYFDHVLRSHESRSEKWEYIRMNPVRAGLVEDPAQWPYAQQFNPFDGEKM